MANARAIGYHAAPFRSRKHLYMQLFVDYLPILIFFGAYFYEDIYFATAILMFVMPVVLIVQWLITRKLNKIYAASTALVLVLGSATLLLRNPQFLYWKPTVLNWAIAIVFLGSQFIGKKPIVQRMMESAAHLTPAQWQRLSLIWVAFFTAIGGINLYVAYSCSEPTWVKFKLFGMLGLTFAFVIVQTVWLTHAMKQDETPDQNVKS
jgi:intracellular septation protein